MDDKNQASRLKENMSVNDKNHLVIGGVDTIDLVQKYGTPLNVYDIGMIKNNLNIFKDEFKQQNQPFQVAYASKAFSSLALYQILSKEDVSLDVVSGGELYLAIKAGFPADRIHFHGNNKSDEELDEAIKTGVGCIVVDNFTELEKLNDLAASYRREISILIRITPGISAHTHEYISTGQEDSKFGFDLQSGQADEAVKIAMESLNLNLIGLHSHIGSQIFETEGFEAVADILLEKSRTWKDNYGFNLSVLNVGGGFGIKYTDEDHPKPKAEYIETICTKVRQKVKDLGLDLPEIWVEPGRSIVGEAGTSLYSVGTEKKIPNVRHYISVDGGMADNIRPALYDAEYTAVTANKTNDELANTYSIAGKACESGDMLIWDLNLPEVKKNDILAVLSTGAYGYAMASNYNRLPRPAVVFIEDGKEFLAIRRESYEDFIRLEQSIY